MALITPITATVNRSPKPCFFVEHKDTALIRTGKGMIGTPNPLICADTQEDLDAELARLGIAIPKTKAQLAAEYFGTLAPEIQQKFGAVFLALSALKDNAEKARGVAALTPANDAEAAAKARLLEILNADRPT